MKPAPRHRPMPASSGRMIEASSVPHAEEAAKRPSRSMCCGFGAHPSRRIAFAMRLRISVLGQKRKQILKIGILRGDDSAPQAFRRPSR